LLVARSLTSLLTQNYPDLGVVLVDDGSSDGTAAVARGLDGQDRLQIIDGIDRPQDWAGKPWALYQGIAATESEWLLLTDADIEHDPGHLATLLAQAERSGADMVSELVALRCQTLAERALVPAFVYFFQLLYPFAWVNDPERRMAAAAGGTVLIRRSSLRDAGGIEGVGAALIDDVELARLVKGSGGKIWLGHSAMARSLRPYPRAADVWRMVARSAYTQLRYSPWLLAATVLGMALLFLLPPAATLLTWHSWAHWFGLGAWSIMAFSFEPTLERMRIGPLWAPLLPLIAGFYMAATIGSARDHSRGRGAVWKQRSYTESQA
jgi:hopene-associated glycosyltransferase HpnB